MQFITQNDPPRFYLYPSARPQIAAAHPSNPFHLFHSTNVRKQEERNDFDGKNKEKKCGN